MHSILEASLSKARGVADIGKCGACSGSPQLHVSLYDHVINVIDVIRIAPVDSGAGHSIAFSA